MSVLTFIERVPVADRAGSIAAIERWKELRRTGWDVTALHARQDHALIGFGYVLEPVQLRLADPVRGPL